MQQLQCTDYAYSAWWGPCQPGGTQTRTITGKIPTGCVGCPPTLPQLTTQCTPQSINGTYKGHFSGVSGTFSDKGCTYGETWEGWLAVKINTKDDGTYSGSSFGPWDIRRTLHGPVPCVDCCDDAVLSIVDANVQISGKGSDMTFTFSDFVTNATLPCLKFDNVKIEDNAILGDLSLTKCWLAYDWYDSMGPVHVVLKKQ